jgi:hypothetical protein
MCVEREHAKIWFYNYNDLPKLLLIKASIWPSQYPWKKIIRNNLLLENIKLDLYSGDPNTRLACYLGPKIERPIVQTMARLPDKKPVVMCSKYPNFCSVFRWSDQ